jgi:hypothetical protein
MRDTHLALNWVDLDQLLSPRLPFWLVMAMPPLHLLLPQLSERNPPQEELSANQASVLGLELLNRHLGAVVQEQEHSVTIRQQLQIVNQRSALLLLAPNPLQV